MNEFFRTYARPVGAVLALLGAAICYWGIVRPIQQVEMKKEEIQISLTEGMVGVMLAAVGITYMVFGGRCVRFFQPADGESKVPAYLVGILLALAGLGVYLALKSYLESKGYVLLD